MIKTSEMESMVARDRGSVASNSIDFILFREAVLAKDVFTFIEEFAQEFHSNETSRKKWLASTFSYLLCNYIENRKTMVPNIARLKAISDTVIELTPFYDSIVKAETVYEFERN